MGKAIMDTATIEQTPANANAKTAGTRLLDLLAGWSNYVSSDEEEGLTDTALKAEDLAALYQEAASLIMPIDDAEDEQAIVQRFVQERLLPLLLCA